MKTRIRFSSLYFILIPLLLVSLPASAVTPIEVQKLLADDGAKEDYFGYSVAVDGDTAIIGSQAADDGDLRNVGAAYVFKRTGGAWRFQAKLMASDREIHEHFGTAVAIDGNTAVIGAHAEDNDELINSGAAYIFIRIGEKWFEQAKLELDDKTSFDYFGRAVAIDDGTVVISAPGRGAVYVYTRGHAWVHVDDWNQEAKLQAGGSSVAIDRDTIVVGASGEASGGLYRSGAAYVFVREGSTWTKQARLEASDKHKYDAFGNSVAIDAHTAIIGAHRSVTILIHGEDDTSEHGAVYVFTRHGSTWGEQAKLLASDKGRIHHFGNSIALEGDKALIGAPGQTDSGTYRNGAAYLFVRVGQVWSEQATLLASDKGRENWFGWSVAMDRNTAVVGARQNSDLGIASGSAYIFDLAPSISVVNDMVSMTPDPSSYDVTRDGTGCPPGYNAKFMFDAQLHNTSRRRLNDLFIRVTRLTNDNVILTSVGSAFGAGAVLPVPRKDDYADQLLAPGEHVDVPFTVCLRRLMPFRFEVDVLGQR